MEIIFMLIAISLIVAVLFLILLLKGIKGGQFEDMQTPAVRILFENKLKTTETDIKNAKPGNNNPGI
jgi:cbb3-type cytochrome oxidase maturation protein